MNEENSVQNMRTARAPACPQWNPIIPVPDAPVGETGGRDERGAAPAREIPFLEDPEGIERRLAAAT